MALPLMPKATAVWLVENTALSFEQIAAFCGMHELEVQAIADGEVAVGITGLDPLANGQLTQEELDRCQKDPAARLQLHRGENPIPQSRQKGARYTPVSKRHDRPDGIAWLLKNHPELSDAQICKLMGTTKPTIQGIRERTHWNAANIKPRNPVILGLCAEADMEKAIIIARGRARRAGVEIPPVVVEPEETPETEDSYSAAHQKEPDIASVFGAAVFNTKKEQEGDEEAERDPSKVFSDWRPAEDEPKDEPKDEPTDESK